MKISSMQTDFSSKSYYTNRIRPKSPSFGIANSSELKKLFTYGLPCMYTGIEMIDPKKVQKLMNKSAFDAAAEEVLETLKPFENSITNIEKQVYDIIKQTAPMHPQKNLQQILKTLTPYYSSQLKSEQLPILDKIWEASQNLKEEDKYKIGRFLEESRDQINEKAIYLPFSSYEFKYKLDKINEDISCNSLPKAQKVMDKLRLEASRLADETSEKTAEQQLNIIKFLKIILKSSILKKDPQLKTLLNEAEKRINHEKLLIPFNRKSFIYDLTKLIETAENQEEILELALSLPRSKNSVAAYIMKFSREPSSKIAYRLLWPNMASIEHILPQSKGGKDIPANFGGAGTRVNAERGNIDFVEQIERVPQTGENSQKYVNRLIYLLKNGAFHKTNMQTRYIDDFVKTINEQSEGKINLDLTELQEHREKGKLLFEILSKFTFQ